MKTSAGLYLIFPGLLLHYHIFLTGKIKEDGCTSN